MQDAFYPLIVVFVALLSMCWLGALMGLIQAKQQKFPIKARYNARMLSGLSGIMVLVGASIWFFLFAPATMAYQREFGENPTLDVRNLRSYSQSSQHQWQTLLRFQAAPATIRRIAKSRKLSPIAPVDFSSSDFHNAEIVDSGALDWWEPDFGNSLILTGWKGINDSTFETVALLYDEKSRIAYYSFYKQE